MHKKYNIHRNIKHDSIAIPPVIVEVAEFNEKGYDKFKNEFEMAHNTGQSIIPVVIDSYGGQVYSLLGMVSIIEASKLPVATILMSKAMSCGAVLFTCGSEGMRYMSSRATIMIHEVSAGAQGKIEEMEVSVDEARRLNDEIYEIMAKNIGQPKNYFKKIANEKHHADWFINPENSLEHNLTNHIGIPTFNIDIDMKTELVLDAE